LRIITQDAKGRTVETLDIINKELDKRGLDKSVTKTIKQQNYTKEEVTKMCDILGEADCPICEESSLGLKAVLLSTTIGIFVITLHNKYIKVGCEECLNREANIAIWLSAFFGWWSRRGFLRTPLSINTNLKSKRSVKEAEHNEFMSMFVDYYIQLIEQYQLDKGKLGNLAKKDLSVLINGELTER